MQGVESNGMLCSGAELGLNDELFPGSEVYGLLILPEDSVPGTDIAPVVGLDDYCLLYTSVTGRGRSVLLLFRTDRSGANFSKERSFTG